MMHPTSKSSFFFAVHLVATIARTHKLAFGLLGAIIAIKWPIVWHFQVVNYFIISSAQYKTYTQPYNTIYWLHLIHSFQLNNHVQLYPLGHFSWVLLAPLVGFWAIRDNLCANECLWVPSKCTTCDMPHTPLDLKTIYERTIDVSL